LAKTAAGPINAILRIMSGVFRLAIKRGQCTRNPLDRVNRAMTVARELKPDELGSHVGNDAVDADSFLSPTDIETLLGAARPGFERTLIETAYLTTALEGEVLALSWSDLELPTEGTGRMAIRRNLSWASTKGEKCRPRYFPPKTKAERRTISIAAPLVADLTQRKLQCPASVDDLVFPTEGGNPVLRDALLRVHFYQARRKCLINKAWRRKGPGGPTGLQNRLGG
jgi:integrase